MSAAADGPGTRGAAAAPRPLAMVSWDGRSAPLALLARDAAAAFDLVVFDYSGRAERAALEAHGLGDATLLSEATECKGDLYRALDRHLRERCGDDGAAWPEYVGLVDDDVLLTVADCNRLLHIARACALDVFSAALSHDSQRSHRFMLRQTQRFVRPVDWVEVMMPFYRGALLRHVGEHLGDNVSSWGVDRWLVPALQKVHGMERTAIVDAVVAMHVRPVRSGGARFRNGRSAAQEAEIMRVRAEALVRERRPELVGSAWHRRTFASGSLMSPAQKASGWLGRGVRGWLERSV